MAAVILPGIPGGVGAGLKAARSVDNAADAIKVVDKAGDAVW